jgi:hypothetical protein
MFDISSQQNNRDKDKPIVDKTSKMKTSLFWLTYSHLGSVLNSNINIIWKCIFKESSFDIEFTTKQLLTEVIICHSIKVKNNI